MEPIIDIEHKIRKGLQEKNVTIIVFFDLKAAYDSIDHTYLLSTLAEKGIKGRMFRWIRNLLSNRKIQVAIEDVLSSEQEINNGVIQGSGISTILFDIIMSTIPEVEPITSDEFADDIAFCVTADTLEEAELLMQDAIERFSLWCKKLKLIINVQKTKAMCFTTKRTNTPVLSLDGVDIEVVKTFRYLGVIFDAPYLTWKPHITMLKDKCHEKLNILKALSTTSWGADRQSLLRINEALSRSKIAYGCPAVLTASDTNLKTLEIIQNSALRVSLGAWRTSNVSALQVEANVVPLLLFIQEQGIKYYYKVLAQGPGHMVHDLIINDRDILNRVWTGICKKPFVLKIREIIDQWGLPRIPNVDNIRYPEMPPWFNIKKVVFDNLQTHTTKAMGPVQNNVNTLATLNTTYSDFLCIYTDGSKAKDNSTGAAFYVPERDFTSKWRLQDTSSIVSAELSALKKATDWLLLQNPPGKSVILTDSKSSLFLLLHKKPKVFTATVQQIQSNLLRLNEIGWTLHFQWIPSHCNIRGNDLVDKAANDARLLPDINHSLELVDLQRHVKCCQAVKWQSLWDMEKQQGTFLGQIKDKLGDWDWCRHAHREIDVAMTRFRLGKIGLNKYLYDIDRSETRICTQCNSGSVEDINHHIFHCTAFTDARQKLIDDLRRLNITVLEINTLLGGSRFSPHIKVLINESMARFIRNCKRLIQ